MTYDPAVEATMGALAYCQNGHFTCFARARLSPYRASPPQNSDKGQGGKSEDAHFQAWRHIAENEGGQKWFLMI